MSGRPWLEALKTAVIERDADASLPPAKVSEALPSEGCERCESPGKVSPPVVDMQTAEEVRGSWGKEERRLIAAGWKPKKRGGFVIWANPEASFYYSQEVALHRLKRRTAL